MIDDIRFTADTQRVFVFTEPFAVPVRGPIQISTAEGVISNFVPDAH
jgi:hypothetical protein